jgi:hypothetical protein
MVPGKAPFARFCDRNCSDAIWIAEITGGTELRLRTDHIPRWFQQAVLDHMS